jgi:HlyD family secretion protein
MTKKTRILIGAIPFLALGGLWVYRSADGSEGPAYRFATVERGNIEATVSATGTLGAVTTVQVGTQVSGQVSAILVDFNDRVKKGQLIARIDPTLQQQTVRDAQAGVERNRAELDQTEREYERNRQLFESKVITETEFSDVQYRVAVARANVKSAQVTLDRARQNLSYTSIYAPIDGIVVERNVDVGQTVAASLSAPQLFLIANDLSRMQILASVDESDIGIIEEGQPVRFSVQAHQNETFTGTVKQVRLQSTTQENVVNYTVVVEVENPNGKLLPGMTATVDFLTGAATDVLTVPNAALRFRATEAMMTTVRPAQGAPARSASAASSDSTRAQRAAAGQRENGPSDARRRNVAMLWYLDESGVLAAARVRTGMTDGQKTEIQGRDLTEGMQVIVGVSAESDAAGSSATSPFQTQQQSGPPRPGGF